MTRIMLAVNDSPAGLAAAREAIRLAHQSAGPVLAVHVMPGPPSGAVESAAEHREGTTTSRDSEQRRALALLTFVSQLAGDADVSMQTRLARGEPAPEILALAASWAPDMIVLGRSGVRHVGQPFVGSEVLHVIEFADVPVLVVPAA